MLIIRANRGRYNTTNNVNIAKTSWSIAADAVVGRRRPLRRVLASWPLVKPSTTCSGPKSDLFFEGALNLISWASTFKGLEQKGPMARTVSRSGSESRWSHAH